VGGHQGSKDRVQPIIIVAELCNAGHEGFSSGGARHDSERFEASSDQVLKLTTRPYQVLAGEQNRANELCVTGADTGFAEPTHANELGQAARIVAVSFVCTHGQHAVRMATVEADSWNITLMQPAPEPSGGGSCFQANPDQAGRPLGKTIGDEIRIGCD
jgi:hypothetical protein